MKLNSQQLQEYCNQCDIQREIHTDWRQGQTYFNVLSELHPELAEEVRAAGVDPFYQDSILPLFFKYIMA